MFTVVSFVWETLVISFYTLYMSIHFLSVRKLLDENLFAAKTRHLLFALCKYIRFVVTRVIFV